jgi:hypothetical protein
LSEEPETTRLPSFEKATDQTDPLWPSNGPISVLPVLTSQIRRVLSEEPETTWLPSFEKATDSTECLWPSNGPISVFNLACLDIPDSDGVVGGARAQRQHACHRLRRQRTRRNRCGLLMYSSSCLSRHPQILMVLS